MSYEWIIIGQVRESLTPGHKEEDKLEGLEWDEKILLYVLRNYFEFTQKY
jgi:hypothetical protein